jgi:ribonuclease E
MPNRMLIDASHQEETRVVVVRGNRIEEFDFESQDKKQLKGNIYLARVTRVEPSLQAAFVEYGGNRHGFLAFSEIHPDYYQIPVADRQALLRAEAEAHEDEEDDEDREERGRGRRRRRGRKPGNGNGGAHADANGEASEDGDATAEGVEALAAHADADVISEALEDNAPAAGDDDNVRDAGGSDANGGEDEVESVGAEDAMEEVRERRRPVRRQYKIQEVIKRRQILLVQVVKEERGNKGAALTTYLSLAGRYSVLMPNTARGGGISRKITNVQDRKRLKDIVKDLEVPQGMGVILRTAGESRTKAEIKRDYEYLMRMWDNVRELTLQSTAPTLVYEEGSLIKRSIRDLYNKDIGEVLVAGEDGYREAKNFMRMLMPSHAKVVQPYRDNAPIFARNGIEAQLDKMLQPQVTLKSGGYIIINQTEALVAIDVNSGRSTKEHSIEDTALQTNLEAAEEVARQLRLRDMAGLIVIDFIDMEENRNNRAVEKKLKECLKNDRARIQVGRISHFGLLEMSRQRIRASVLESTMQPCPHCGGTGHVRSESSVALLVMRAIEESLLKDNRHNITVRTPTSTALYMLNHKRGNLSDMEVRFGLKITIEADESVRTQHYAIMKGTPVENPITIEAPVMPMIDDVDEPEIEDVEDEVEVEIEEERVAEKAAPAPQADGEQPRKRKRRRRRRGGRDQQQPNEAEAKAPQDGEAEAEEADANVEDGAEDEATSSDGARKKRRRGKRGGRRNRRDEAEGSDSEGTANDLAEAAMDASGSVADVAALDDQAMTAVETASSMAAETAGEASEAAFEEASAEAAEPAAKKKRAPRRKKAAEPEVAEAAADLDDGAAVAEEAPKPKKRAPRKKKVVEQAEEASTQTISEEPAEAAEPVANDEQAPEPEAQPSPVEEPTAPAEPVVVSNGQASDETEAKPRKTGWWSRKTFF